MKMRKSTQSPLLGLLGVESFRHITQDLIFSW